MDDYDHWEKKREEFFAMNRRLANRYPNVMTPKLDIRDLVPLADALAHATGKKHVIQYGYYHSSEDDDYPALRFWGIKPADGIGFSIDADFGSHFFTNGGKAKSIRVGHIEDVEPYRTVFERFAKDFEPRVRQSSLDHYGIPRIGNVHELDPETNEVSLALGTKRVIIDSKV